MTSEALTRIDEQGRPEPPTSAGELGTLLGFLDFLRATLAWRTSGLGSLELARRLDGHPSEMTLGGLLKHLAFVEAYWFLYISAQQPMPEPWASVDWDADPDWDWHSAASNSADELRGLWGAAVEESRRITAALVADPDADLGAQRSVRDGEQVSLRWILAHMIEEYARHAGHADLLREVIDGQRGE